MPLALSQKPQRQHTTRTRASRQQPPIVEWLRARSADLLWQCRNVRANTWSKKREGFVRPADKCPRHFWFCSRANLHAVLQFGSPQNHLFPTFQLRWTVLVARVWHAAQCGSSQVLHRIFLPWPVLTINSIPGLVVSHSLQISGFNRWHFGWPQYRQRVSWFGSWSATTASHRKIRGKTGRSAL
jgi:hypothetical protein